MERKTFINFINILEGFKTIFKEYHWISKSSSHHVYLDELLSELIEFQDNFAEEGIVVYGEIIKNEISGLKVETIDQLDALRQLNLTVNKILSVCNSAGITNLCMEFLHIINKYIFLLRMN